MFETGPFVAGQRHFGAALSRVIHPGRKGDMGRDDPDATVTAGNASGQNDGASICVVTHPAKAQELGLRPPVRLVSWGVGGVPPATMGSGPVPAVAKALDTAALGLADRCRSPRSPRDDRDTRKPAPAARLAAMAAPHRGPDHGHADSDQPPARLAPTVGAHPGAGI